VTRTLRTTWAMVNASSLVALSGTLALIVAGPLTPKPVRAMIPVAIAITFGVLATQVSRVLQVGIWRMLPDGFRTAFRAVATLVVALTLLFVALHSLTRGPDFLPGTPFGTLLVFYLYFSLFAFLLVLGMGRRLPPLLLGVLFFPCILALGFAMRAFRDVPAFWMGSAAICTLLWVVGSFGNFRAPNYSRREIGWDKALTTILARADRTLTLESSAARRVLRQGSSALGNVSTAIVILSLIALMQHATVGRLKDIPFLFFVAMPILCVGIFAAFHGSKFGLPAKRLWLLWAPSRAQLFRLVERVVVRDVCFVAAASWAVIMALALSRGIEMDVVNALKLLVAGLGVATTLAYTGMLFTTAYRWWSALAFFAVGVFCLIQSHDWWFEALSVTHPDVDRVRSAHIFRPAWLVLAMSVIFVLRQVALARWKRLDWSHYRSSRKRT
jgi:hypothetical protein